MVGSADQRAVHTNGANMSPQWLERLNQATEYRDLQSVFAEIAADARSVTDSAQLAASIDEAIYRIQRESLRDEQELAALRGEYETFKQQHKGVIGWLKRHIPFTETRRREKHHTQTVSVQEAEVLADNLIIALADDQGAGTPSRQPTPGTRSRCMAAPAFRTQ